MPAIDPNLWGGFYRHFCRYCRKEFFSSRRDDHECCNEHTRLYKQRKRLEAQEAKHDAERMAGRSRQGD